MRELVTPTPTTSIPVRDDSPAGRLASVFADVVGVAGFDADQSFFDAGGHSLLALKLIDQIGQRLGVDATIADLHLAPSPAPSPNGSASPAHPTSSLRSYSRWPVAMTVGPARTKRRCMRSTRSGPTDRCSSRWRGGCASAGPSTRCRSHRTHSVRSTTSTSSQHGTPR
ncbi:MAG: acyl carrier protein [Desertimonas sp.]